MADQPRTHRQDHPDDRLATDPTPSPVPRPAYGRLLVSSALVAVLAIPTLTWAVRSLPTGNEPPVVTSPTSVGDRSALGSEVPPPAEATGGAAPHFTVALFDGRTFSLSRHLAEDGRPLVMNFWASWCVPCLEEMPAFDAVARRRSDVLFLGVAVLDSEEAVRGFAAEIGVTYPLSVDGEGLIIERYPTLGLPTTWFITTDGTIAEQRIGGLDQEELEDLIDRHLTA